MLKLTINENIDNYWYNPNYDKKQLFEIWKVNDLNNDNIFMSITKNINLGKHICTYIKNSDDKNNIFYVPTNSRQKIVLNIEYLKNNNAKKLESLHFNNIENAKIKYNKLKFKHKVYRAYALIFTLESKKEWCDINYEKII